MICDAVSLCQLSGDSDAVIAVKPGVIGEDAPSVPLHKEEPVAGRVMCEHIIDDVSAKTFVVFGFDYLLDRVF